MEIEIRSPRYRAVVATYGASLRKLERSSGAGAWEDLIWGYSGNENKKGGQGDVLIPFPGRVRDGAYEHEGRAHQLKRNDKDGPNAIHGFLRAQEWSAIERSASRAVFGASIAPTQFEGYPFSLEARLEYTLSDSGLACSFRITNTGREIAPVSAGFHPYFTVGTPSADDAEARIPATHLIEFDSSLLPTGKLVDVRGGDLDYLKPRKIGATRFNHCYARLARDADGLARAALIDPVTGRQVTVWMDRAFDYVVVYTGDALGETERRKSLAIEPMTCATDAFNRPDWGLARLLPGQSFEGSFGVS